MTERKQLPEQIAFHTYRLPAVSGIARDPQSESRDESTQSKRKENKSRLREETVVLQRMVSVPQADPSIAWNAFAERQEQLRRTRAQAKKYVETVPRTYVLTGMRASSGRIKAVNRSVPVHSSPVPARSGRLLKRRSFFWKVLGLFAASVLLILAVSFALTGNAFRIQQVSVSGTQNDALIQRIQHMGMQGQNIFLVDIAALTERIEAIPQVSSASLSRQLPNQLVVQVTERVPLLLWRTTQGTYSVDSQGVVIAAQRDTVGANRLAIVVDLSGQKQSNGKQAQTGAHLQPGMHLNQADILFAKTLFDRLPTIIGTDAFTLQYDGTIYAGSVAGKARGDGGGTYIVESPAGWKAYLGDASDTNPLENKLGELQQILALTQKQRLTLATIDLRYGLRPVYTLK
ncbi:MAG: FtsQ-type POTRA domain-containing protein [Ktedonobacteraceae bacterium]|nr:FtsQ-type POTRA domain-containing protein [Ktedonobacteraceae bacterium]